MSVRHILAEKGSHVEVIGSEATLEDAVQILGLKRIGAVWCCIGGRPGRGVTRYFVGARYSAGDYAGIGGFG